MIGLNRFWLVLSLLACLAVGCGGSEAEPELGMVKGTVTVDGAPGANLQITFEPQLQKGSEQSVKNVGAGSSAQTDDKGMYELKYKGKNGAVVGKHLVRIEPIAGGGPAGGDKAVPIGVVIPAEFNTQSTMIREVQKGENTINLEVTTK